MNRINYYTGGVGLREQDLQFIQDTSVGAINGLTGMFNTQVPVIISGMIVTGQDVSAGWVLEPYTQEIMYHPATTYAGTISGLYIDKIVTTSGTRNYSNGATHDFWTLNHVTLVVTASVWTSPAVTYGNAKRYDTFTSALYDSSLVFNTGDIYSTDGGGLQLQSNFNYRTLPLHMVRYGGEIVIGGAVSNAGPTFYSDVTTYVKGQVQMMNQGLESIYAGPYNSGSINISAVNWDRVIYLLSDGTVSTDFKIAYNIAGSLIGKTGAYLGASYILPAGLYSQINLESGTATTFYAQALRFGRAA